MPKVIIITILLLVLLGWVAMADMSKDEEQRRISKQSYMAENKYIKEMSTDMITSGSISGGYLLIGGSFYGTIDTHRSLTVVYGTWKDDTTVYKVLTLSLDKIEIVTMGKDEKPYLKVTELNYGEIMQVRLFLPDGWEILSLSKEN